MFLKLFALSLSLFTIGSAQIISTATFPDTTNSTNNIRPYFDTFTCNCDYYSNVCDTYCCCDPDCASTVVEAWTAENLCIVAEDTSGMFEKCPDESLLQLLTDPKSQQATNIKQLSTFLCVEYDMAPYAGYFFLEDKTTSSNSQASSFRIKNDAINTARRGALTESGSYSRSQSLYYLSGTQMTQYTFPKANQFGFCDYSNIAAYLVDIPASTCTPTSFSCSDAIALRTSLEGNIPLAAPQSSASPITITVATTAPAPTAYDTNTCTCSNVLRGVDLDLTYDASGVLTGGQVFYSYGDVEFEDCTGANPPTTDSPMSLQQTFSLKYTTSLDAIPKSGSSGYVIGKPLIVGTEASTTETFQGINRPVGDMKIQGVDPLTGECSTFTGELNPDMIPNFGENSTYSCTVPTLPQADCDTTFISSLTFFQNFVQGTTKIGRFGNSNIHNELDWVDVDADGRAVYEISADASRGNCVLSVEQQVYVFYSVFGLEDEPLYYIIKVVSAYVTGTVSFDAEAKFSITFKYIRVSEQDL